MSSTQLIILGLVVLLILITISYYLYQEIKFKRLVENNFNQSTEDVLIEENKAFILDGVNEIIDSNSKPILQKDVYSDDDEHITLLNDEEEPVDEALADPVKQVHKENDELSIISHPEDSVEAFFANIYKIPFPFANEIDPDLDFVIDVGFEEVTKLKSLPDVGQFTNKEFRFYVLDRNDEWHIFSKGTKYNALAVKFVIHAIDKNGIISQAQIANIYNELHNFVMQNNAHICRSDYETMLAKIQQQLKNLDKVKLNLNLFLIFKESHAYSHLSRLFANLGFSEINGRFLALDEDNETIFSISDENGQPLDPNLSYSLLQISSDLHRQKAPGNSINLIFDHLEKCMEIFESRLLTANHQVVTQKEYDAIINHVNQYVVNAKRNHIELGSSLIKRLY